MKLIAISDTHGLHRELELPTGDILIHAGDFCPYNARPDEVLDFLQWLGEQDFQHKIFIAGNHDFMAEDEPDRFEEMIPDGVIYLNDSGVEIEGLNIWGSPVQPDLAGWAFGKRRGLEMRRHWDMIPFGTDILITHTPPSGILDQSSSGRHYGCEELSQKLFFISPQVHIFGHIHASYGMVEDEGTIFINASNIETGGGIVHEAVCVQLE